MEAKPQQGGGTATTRKFSYQQLIQLCKKKDLLLKKAVKDNGENIIKAKEHITRMQEAFKAKMDILQEENTALR